MKILSGLTQSELEQLTDNLGASRFRARQIHNWIYLKSVKSIDEMTDLSVKFRDELKKSAVVSDTKIKVKQVSSDGTIKYANFEAALDGLQTKIKDLPKHAQNMFYAGLDFLMENIKKIR